MLSGQDRPVLLALVAVAFALFLNVGASFAESAQQPNSAAGSQIGRQNVTAPTPEVREAIATEVVADYTRKLALLTAVLAAIGIVTSCLTFWQIKLARDEFNATHRPQIIVHSVKYDPIVSESGDFDFNKAAATVTYYNTGASDAVIENIRYIISQRRLPLESGIFPSGEASPKHTRIESGMGDYIELGSDVDLRTVRLASDSASRLILIGRIFYRDKAGSLRQTGFCRALVSRGSQGFAWDRLDAPEYEYGY